MVLDQLLLDKWKISSEVASQRTELNDAYSSWSVAGVPQGLILGLFLFKTIWTDLFLYPEETFLSNYTENDALDVI